MTERHQQIIRLLNSRHDGLPELSVRRDHSTAGFIHRSIAREACSDCLTNDRTTYGCETCHGRGYTERVRDRDPMAVDKVTPYGFDSSRHERARERDQSIARLEDQLRLPWSSEADAIAYANAHPFAYEVVRRRMYTSFSYGPLDRAIEQLRLTHPGLSPYSTRGLDFLDRHMPHPIKAPAEPVPAKVPGKLERGAGTKAREQRDREIRQLAKDGSPYPWIAKQFGLSDRQLREIINRKRTAA